MNKFLISFLLIAIFSTSLCQKADCPDRTQIDCFNGQCVVKNGQKTCQCYQGWNPADLCKTQLPDSKKSCADHTVIDCYNGYCAFQNGFDVCVCYDGWSQADNCKTQTTPNPQTEPTAGQQTCGGQTIECWSGQCIVVNGVATCQCYQGWDPADKCKSPLPDSKKSCADHTVITCYNGYCAVQNGFDVCVCYNGWSQADNCKTQTTPNPQTEPTAGQQTCGGQTIECWNGQCVVVNGVATCKCFLGWNPADHCNTQLPFGKALCSDNTVINCYEGTCIKKNNQNVCQCYAGWNPADNCFSALPFGKQTCPDLSVIDCYNGSCVSQNGVNVCQCYPGTPISATCQ